MDIVKIKARFGRNLSHAREALRNGPEFDKRYQLGRVDAIIQSWAEMNDIGWHEAEIDLSC